jgi:hypothetical protein
MAAFFYFTLESFRLLKEKKNIKMEDEFISFSNLVQVSRPALNFYQFEENFPSSKLKSENVFKSAAHYCSKNYKPSGRCMTNY